MDKLRITGNGPLHGTIPISGAKNAALPLMAACLLTDQPLTLTNVPQLADINTMDELLSHLGVSCSPPGGEPKSASDNAARFDGGLKIDAHLPPAESANADSTPPQEGSKVLTLDASSVATTTAPYDIVRKMRASVLVLGPLLARQGHARVSLPGGCAIGTRPVDLHIHALKEMGAEIELSEGYINAKVKDRLKGAEIAFDTVSVGATENVLMAAALAEGETVITNAAREPEVADLAECLVKMGAKIDGIGRSTIHVTGVDSLHAAEHSVVPDRIEAGSYAIAAAMTGGELLLRGARAGHLTALFDKMEEAGVEIRKSAEGITVKGHPERLSGIDVMTQPFPGFPTDMQAQFMALMSVASGASMLTETIFENRFMHAPELMRMGANITVHTASAMVRGVPKLKGAEVMATDLRASMSLVLAALAAEGETLINRIYHLDRGYEKLEAKLAACGAKIERIKENK